VLTTKLLLAAYCQGIFPMAVNARGDLAWFSPDPRAIIPLDDRFHIPHGLKRLLKRQLFDITFDNDFGAVIRACAKSHGSTWISKEIIRGYSQLYELGFAHSVEVWLEDKLAGGLYGVQIGAAFFGESMFHDVTDASKVALVALVECLRAKQFLLLDTQWTTRHLLQFGAYEIPKAEYMQLLSEAIAQERKF
jgi:leucyl/phenylalanyl-tRNA--protein transferase